MRKNGYYWLKMSWGEWIIKRWNGETWDFPFIEYRHSVSCIQEIDETPITRPTPAEAFEKLGDALRKQGFK